MDKQIKFDFDPPTLKDQLNKDQRIILFHDGSMTKLLELISCQRIQILIIKETNPNNEQQYLDQTVNQKIIGEKILRQSYLLTDDGKKMVYARSIWPQESYNGVMYIGMSLISERTEQFREMVGVFKLDNKFVNQMCGMEFTQEYLYARCYYIWSDKQIMTYIEEYFFCI